MEARWNSVKWIRPWLLCWAISDSAKTHLTWVNRRPLLQMLVQM
jgi:hypothetical protein